LLNLSWLRFRHYHLLTSYGLVDLLETTSIDLPQQAGIPCIAAAVATAIEQ
jgi:hypothetical protein